MQLPKKEDRGAHHNTQIYYDSDRDYKTALKSGIPQRFFEGNMNWENFKINKQVTLLRQISCTYWNIDWIETYRDADMRSQVRILLF